MAYTNVTIPDRYSTVEQFRKQIHDLKSELKFYQEQYDYVLSILENIPKSVVENGFVELSFEKEKITLVDKNLNTTNGEKND